MALNNDRNSPSDVSAGMMDDLGEEEHLHLSLCSLHFPNPCEAGLTLESWSWAKGSSSNKARVATDDTAYKKVSSSSRTIIFMQILALRHFRFRVVEKHSASYVSSVKQSMM